MNETGMNGTIRSAEPYPDLDFIDRSTWPAPPGAPVNFTWPAARTLRDGLYWPTPRIQSERQALVEDAHTIKRGGTIYYLELDDHNARIIAPLKIGFTVDLAARIKGLKKIWGPMILIASEPGGRALEQLRHWQFMAARMPAMPLPGGSEMFEQDRTVHPLLSAHIDWLLESHYGLTTSITRPFLPGMEIPS